MRILSLCLVYLLSLFAYGQTLPIGKIHTYKAGGFNSGSVKDLCFDHTVQQLYSVNQNSTGFRIIDYSDVSKPNVLQLVDVSGFMSNIRSIEAATGFVFVAGDGSSAQLPGKLLIYTNKGIFVKQLSLGATPDRMGFSDNNRYLIIANEGVPDDNHVSDPQGTVNIIDVSSGINPLTQADVKTVDFTLLDTTAYDPLIHIYAWNGALPSQDVEPEAVTVRSDNNTALIALQENNAIAVIDLSTASLTDVKGLGYRDYSVKGLDASDVGSSVNIATHPRLYGIHQPSDLASFSHMNADYVLTVNQGDPRDYTMYNEMVQVKNQPVDPSKFNNLADLLNDTVLGRLWVTSEFGDMNGDLLKDSLFSFGSRSISILDSTGTEIWNSGDEMAQIVLGLQASNFNSSSDDNNSLKNRSVWMGVEPTALAIGEVDGTRYAFISLYQMGGVFIYDISDPANPVFEMYQLDRDFSVAASDPLAGDMGPLDLEFVSASNALQGLALLFVANRVSSTISVYQMGIGLGSAEIESEDEALFPNPGTGIYYAGSRGNYKVYTLSGKLIKEISNSSLIDLQDQNNGIYIIQNENGRSVKVIKH